MIFGAVINEEMKEEIMVTVIATGFDDQPQTDHSSPSELNKERGGTVPPLQQRMEQKEGHVVNSSLNEHDLDIPTFLRNRMRRK